MAVCCWLVGTCQIRTSGSASGIFWTKAFQQPTVFQLQSSIRRKFFSSPPARGSGDLDAAASYRDYASRCLIKDASACLASACVWHALNDRRECAVGSGLVASAGQKLRALPFRALIGRPCLFHIWFAGMIGYVFRLEMAGSRWPLFALLVPSSEQASAHNAAPARTVNA